MQDRIRIGQLRALGNATLRAIVTALVLVPAAAPAQAPAITASDAVVREAPAGRTVTAAFLELTNTSNAPRRVVKVSSDVASAVEMHAMRMADGRMSMAPVASIEVPANGRVELKPGGLHLMLFGLNKPLRDGDRITLRLLLDNGAMIVVPTRVIRP